MVRHTEEVIVRRPVSDVFDFLATHNYENHPRWEAEVVEIRPITAGPLRVGSRAVMVRKEFGKVRETTHECTALEHDRLVAFRHVDGPMDFTIAFAFSAVAEGTLVRIDVHAGMRGRARLLNPIVGLRMPRISRRLGNRMREVVEADGDPGLSSPQLATGG